MLPPQNPPFLVSLPTAFGLPILFWDPWLPSSGLSGFRVFPEIIAFPLQPAVQAAGLALRVVFRLLLCFRVLSVCVVTIFIYLLFQLWAMGLARA